MIPLQIIYHADCFEPSTPTFYNGWLDEMEAMRALGLSVSDKPAPDAEKLLYRSYIINDKKDFPDDPRYISRWEDYMATSDMSKYLPLIEDLTIPSFIAQELDESTEKRLLELGWEKAFVRSGLKSLKYTFPESDTEEDLPVWPAVSMTRLAEAYNECRDYMGPPYIIRKYIPEEVMIHEERYWVINNNAYHRSGIIPDVVKTAVERLKQLNAPYYVIDATPDFIVEINPGVSSDPYPDNIPHHFPKWIYREFAEKQQ